MNKHEREFKDLLDVVALDARGEAAEEQSAGLREPDMLSIWRDALSAIQADIDAQLSSKKSQADQKRQMLDDRVEAGVLTKSDAEAAWRDFRATEDQKRLKTLWFRRSVKRRFAENSILRKRQQLRTNTEGGS